jgi:predicted phosphodiesterase
VRVAILADIHANLPALETALRDVRSQRCDRVMSLGDAVGIGPYPSETLELLLAEGIAGIMGNHEEYLLRGFPTSRSGMNSVEEIDHQQWTQDRVSRALKEKVREWPYEERIPYVRGSARLLHFAYDEGGITAASITSDADVESVFGEHDPVTIFGHTHRSLDLRRKARYLNPGALGCSRDEYARYLIMDVSGAKVDFRHRMIRYPKKVLLDEFVSRHVPARDEIFRIFYGA